MKPEQRTRLRLSRLMKGEGVLLQAGTTTRSHARAEERKCEASSKKMKRVMRRQRACQIWERQREKKWIARPGRRWRRIWDQTVAEVGAVGCAVREDKSQACAGGA